METINSPEIDITPNTKIVESDLKYIFDNKLVLRHCKSQQNATDEVENNRSDGDALAISALDGITDDFGFDMGIFVFSKLDESKKLLLLQRYNSSIDNFMKDSCGWDINKEQKSAFIIGTSRSHFSYDKDRYYGLGKIGSGSIVDIVDSFIVGEDKGAKSKDEFENSVKNYSMQMKNQFVEFVRKGVSNLNQQISI